MYHKLEKTWGALASRLIIKVISGSITCRKNNHSQCEKSTVTVTNKCDYNIIMIISITYKIDPWAITTVYLHTLAKMEHCYNLHASGFLIMLLWMQTIWADCRMSPSLKLDTPSIVISMIYKDQFCLYIYNEIILNICN